MEDKANHKSFLHHFTLIGGGTLLNILLGVITTPIITRLVGPVEYGKLSVFTMYSGIALTVFCLGLDQALIRWYYECRTLEEKHALLFKCIKFPIVLAIFASVLIIGMSAAGKMKFEFETAIVTALCLYIIIEIFDHFGTCIVRLDYNSRVASLQLVLYKVSYICFVIPMLLWIDGRDLYILVAGTMLSSLLCTILIIVSERKIWRIHATSHAKCNVGTRELLTYSYPYIFSMGITALFQTADKMALNTYCSYAEVGVYAAAMNMVHIFAIITSTFKALWQPMAVEHYTRDRGDKSFYQRGNQTITVIMFFIGITLILLKDIFSVLLGEQYREAAYILPFLIFNPIMNTISETTVTGLVFMKKSKLQVFTSLGACTANVIGNAILVPKLGCQGAAISTGLSYIIFFSLRTVLSNTCFYVDFKLKKFYILTVLTVVYAFYNTFFRLSMWTVIGYAVCLGAMCLLYRDTIEWGAAYLKNYICSMIKK